MMTIVNTSDTKLCTRASGGGCGLLTVCDGGLFYHECGC